VIVDDVVAVGVLVVAGTASAGTSGLATADNPGFRSGSKKARSIFTFDDIAEFDWRMDEMLAAAAGCGANYWLRLPRLNELQQGCLHLPVVVSRSFLNLSFVNHVDFRSKAEASLLFHHTWSFCCVYFDIISFSSCANGSISSRGRLFSLSSRFGNSIHQPETTCFVSIPINLSKSCICEYL